jgi:hypothetical protein
MANIVAELPGESSNIVIISSHFDTKLFWEFKFVARMTAVRQPEADGNRARWRRKTEPEIYLSICFLMAKRPSVRNGTIATIRIRRSKTPLPDNTYGSRQYVSQLVEKMKSRASRR